VAETAALEVDGNLGMTVLKDGERDSLLDRPPRHRSRDRCHASRSRNFVQEIATFAVAMFALLSYHARTMKGASRMRSTIREADGVACRLASALTRWVVVVSRVALRVFEDRAWSRRGFSSKRDFCVERLGVSSRQFELWVEAARMFSRFPALADAVVGDDGGAPLGLCKALWVGRRADEASLTSWIALAREQTFRQLQSIDALPEAEGEARARWSIPAPEGLGRAFEAGLLLHRKLSGGEASVASFVEMLLADAAAEGSSWEQHVEAAESVDPRALVEERMARAAGNWRSLPAVVAANESLARFENAGQLDDPLEALVRLCAIQHELELRLGEVLCELSQHGAWPQLLFTCAGHYAVERLGLSRSSMEDNARLHRRLKRLPLLKQAYVAGQVSREAALLVSVILRDRIIDAATEAAWVERAKEATIKRLRDEQRAQKFSPTDLPMTDDAWATSIASKPGDCFRSVLRSGLESLDQAHNRETFSLTLPASIAQSLGGAVESRRTELEEAAQLGDLFAEIDPSLPPSHQAARMFSQRARKLPSWVGLLSLLENFAGTYDQAEKRSASRDQVFTRSGHRCQAPCCSRRAGLESHHVIFRSAGGSDEPGNLVGLCAFHHHHGVHGGLLEIRGTDATQRRFGLGPKSKRTWYRHERVDRPVVTEVSVP
jgi:hypothetical protein